VFRTTEFTRKRENAGVIVGSSWSRHVHLGNLRNGPEKRNRSVAVGKPGREGIDEAHAKQQVPSKPSV
jgi:hypothetical protein